MSHASPSRSSAPTRPDQQLRRGHAAAPQPRSLSDKLDRLTPRVDELTYRARLAPLSPREYDELEELADGIARDLRAAFRGPARDEPRATAPILWRSPDGNGFLV